MNNALRCPKCNMPPSLFLDKECGSLFDGLKDVVLHCSKHGHMARGKDLAQAVLYWNIYIEFIKRDSAKVA